MKPTQKRRGPKPGAPNAGRPRSPKSKTTICRRVERETLDALRELAKSGVKIDAIVKHYINTNGL